jgi:hypothetical protein
MGRRPGRGRRARGSLSALPWRFVYAYDFGDGWEHEVEVLGRGGNSPACVGGEGACPPEDCGGPYGYTELLEALADDRHSEHESMHTWVGDRLRPFDQETNNSSDKIGTPSPQPQQDQQYAGAFASSSSTPACQATACCRLGWMPSTAAGRSAA